MTCKQWAEALCNITFMLRRWEQACTDARVQSDKLMQRYCSLWRDHLGIQMLLMDCLFTPPPTPNGLIRRIWSPNSHKNLNLSHPAVLAHRAFNFMDRDGDGIISWADICEWTCIHVQTGTLDGRLLWRDMTGGDYGGARICNEDERRLINWHADQIWAMAKEAFAPVSREANWQVCQKGKHQDSSLKLCCWF